MNIAKILEKTITIPVDYNGETVNLEIYEECLSPKLAQTFAEAGSSPLKIAEGLSNVIHGWDIDYNGTAFPPTLENIARLPLDFLTTIIDLLNEFWAGKEQKPSQSGNGSAAAETVN